MNEGGSSTSYHELTSYDGASSTFTATTTALDYPLTAGTIYKFKSLALNAYGVSDYSEELNAGVGALPAQPAQVTKVTNESSETTITLEWGTSADTDLPVVGYSLKVNDGVGGDVYTDVFK